MSYSQLDITETCDAKVSLKPEDLVNTTPLNLSTADQKSVGLPEIGADEEIV